MSDVVFVTRQRCSLCHVALPVVEAVVARSDHVLTVIDVDDAGWADRYGDRVPVVLRDGAEVLSGRFGRREVRAALR